MGVERRLQICLAATAALGTLLLGLGQANYTLPIVAVFAAITSVYFTDHLGWFRLNRHAANVLALGAVGFTVMDVFQQDAGRQLVAIANLLIYLQIILLYQQKKLRLYWHVLVLSLLQVVVAAALNLGVEFGLLLILYMFLSLQSLTLLFILCETANYTIAAVGDGPAANFALAPMPRMQRATAESEDQPRLSAVLSTDRPAEAMLTRGLAKQVVRLGFTTLILTFIVFFLTPRFGKSTWRGGALGKERLVGFTEEVSLNDIGRIQESTEKVMRVQFVSDSDLMPYDLRSELFLRGSVLRDYEPYSGRWRALRPRSHDQVKISEIKPHTAGVVRQTTSLENSEVLFSTMPAVSVPETPPNVVMSAEMGQLYRQPPEPKGMAGHFRYVVGTRAFINGRQRQIVPRRFGTEKSDYGLSTMRGYLRFDERALPSLRDIAKSIIEAAEVEPDDRIGAIRALEAHLQRLDMFRYTDELTELPPKGMDPIEHFLTETRKGHCEYFASALTLLLRSQEIPARVVVGFKGGDYNRMGHYYQVRQLHAHAWVEAFLEPEHVPENAILIHEIATEGAWMRIDPTPLESEPLLTFVGANLFDRMSQMTEYMQTLWNDYILGMDNRRQQEAIYKPIMDSTFSAFTEYLFDAEWRSVFFGELVTKLGVDSLSSFHRTWFNWRALPLVIGLVLLFVATYLVLRRPVQRLGAKLWGGFKKRLLGRLWKNRETAFYYRLEKILRRNGLRRAPGQTPYELALAVGRIGSQEDARSARAANGTSDGETANAGAEAARDIVDLFYRVRYGGRPLDASEAKSVEQKLVLVERASRTHSGG